MTATGLKDFFCGSYGGLLLSLVLLMLLQPTVDTTVGKHVMEVLFVAVLFTGLRAIELRKNLLRFEICLLLVSLVLNGLGAVTGNEVLFFLGIAGRVFFLVLVALIILADLFRGREVSGDKLAGAVCVYMLLAVIWAYLFLLIEVAVPGSFSFTQRHEGMALWLSQEYFQFFYFSLVTITTVGYGDTSPVSTMAQTFATFEAMLGQVYLTILVARLVGMYLAQKPDDDSRDAKEEIAGKI